MLCYDTGRRQYTKQFVVFVRNRNESGPWRLGLAVTRKTGCAVVRNRVKRVVREFFRLHREILPGGHDLVVVPKRTLRPETLTLAVAGQEFTPLLAGFAPPVTDTGSENASGKVGSRLPGVVAVCRKEGRR